MFDPPIHFELLTLAGAMAGASWQEGLARKGLYFEGIIDGERVDSLLEQHRKETVSTFGTRRSCRTTPAGSENVSLHAVTIGMLFAVAEK